MAGEAAARVCLISSMPLGSHKNAWRAKFVELIQAARLTPADYSSAAVDDARCLLAFAPGGESEVLYQVAYAVGRGLPVLLVMQEGDDASRFDPRPAAVVDIDLQAPDPVARVRESITSTLVSIAQSRPATIGHHGGLPPSSERSRGAVTSMISTVEQAEALLDSFLNDGLSERVIHRLLLEAGCRASWVEFRLRQHFGGW